MDDSLDSSHYYREPPGKAQRLKRKASLGNNVTPSAGENVAGVEIHPVVLQSSLDRTLKSFNPIDIDRCLKCVGDYDACLPRQNGNHLVKCKSPQQMKTLLIHLLPAMARSPSQYCLHYYNQLARKVSYTTCR